MKAEHAEAVVDDDKATAGSVTVMDSMRRDKAFGADSIVAVLAVIVLAMAGGFAAVWLALDLLR